MQVRIERSLRELIVLYSQDIDVKSCDATMQVVGTTGSMYRVRVSVEDQQTSCTCMDYKHRSRYDRDHRCKHIFFVLRRAFRLTASEMRNPFRLSDWRERMQRQADARHGIPEVIPDDDVPDPDTKEKKKEKEKDPEPDPGVDRKPFDGLDCPFCFEPMEATATDEPTRYCVFQCGQSWHAHCFDQYYRVARKNECVYCRASLDKSLKKRK